ncbi:MAG TPA: hypothetical protein VGJ07_01765 [Rugosimonospora sp.]
MTPEETAQAAKPVVVRLGAAFGHEPEFVDRGERLGLGSGRWPFCFGGRAGVLGTVGADVVAGLTPVQAILAGPGSRRAAANGWQPPYPEVPDGAAPKPSVGRSCWPGSRTGRCAPASEPN